MSEDDGGIGMDVVNRLKKQIASLRLENDDLSDQIGKFRLRINSVEEEKVQETQQFNEQNSELQSLVAKLESQLENAEAKKQTIEVELAITRKKSNDLVRSTHIHEASISNENKKLQEDNATLQTKVDDLENALQIARKVTMEDEKRIAFLVDDKKQLEADKLAEQAIMRANHDKLIADLESKESRIHEFDIKVQQMQQSLIRQEEDVRRKSADLQVAAEREDNLRKDLNELATRSRALEESVEAERAAHLESKFNAEIIQLKQHEAQVAINSERDACMNLQKDLHLANQNIDKLQQQLFQEKDKNDKSNNALQETKDLQDRLQKQLNYDLDQKNKMIKEMTTQINKHQQGFNTLKEELNETKKKQILLEETYSGNMKEVELLLATYCHDNKQPERQTKSKQYKQIDPKIILDRLKSCMFEHQRTVDNFQRDLDELQRREKEARKDSENFRDLALSREKSLHQAQEDISKAEMELNRIRMQHQEYDHETQSMHRDLEVVTSELEHQTNRCRELEEDTGKLSDRHSTEMEAHVSFLRELHHALGSHSRAITALTRFTWSELSTAVREGVDSIKNTLDRANDKTTQLEVSCGQLERTVGELQREHEASVDRLARECRERENESQRQRKQLEDHYNALLAEMHTRTQKSQTLCDEAWERIRTNGGVSDGLQAECVQLRGEKKSLVQDRMSLSCACCLLLGVIYPVFRCRDDLAEQRALLTRLYNETNTFKKQLRMLVETLSEELRKPNEEAESPASSFKYVHPLFRFRASAVAVIAANRLVRLAKDANVTMFTCSESAVTANNLIVKAGTTATLGLNNEDGQSGTATSIAWLSDNQTVHALRDATCGLVDSIQKSTGSDNGYMSRAIVKTSKTAFVKILQTTHKRFSSMVVPENSVIRERTSICRLLADGLERIIRRRSLVDKINLFSVQFSLSALQKHLLDFTKRLHAAEVEKRNLRNSEITLKEQIQELIKYKADFEVVEEETKNLKDREKQLVPRQKFDGVCLELNSALAREQRAQKLLREQNNKLQDLSMKLDIQYTETQERESTFNEAVKALNEVKMELKRALQSKKQLSKQVSKLENQHMKLEHNITDAKDALKKAANEKNSLANYFACVEKLVEENPTEASQLLSSFPMKDFNKVGPDVEAAQKAVESFVRVQSSAISRIGGLENQISSYRSHITALKKELHDVCNRDGLSIEHGIDFPTHDLSPRVNGYSSDEAMTPKNSEFKELKGIIADESMFSIPRPTNRKRMNQAN